MPAREAWGLDLGQTALHAVKVRRGKGGDAEIVDTFFRPFDLELNDPDLDTKVEEALEEFVDEKKVGQTPVVASLPAFTTIFRDFPLPAVSDSRLAEIVSYEAKQIIPFPLEETVWDYQKVRTDEDTGEVGIALICCRRDIIEGVLETLDEAGLNIEALQVAPFGLVNYVQYEAEPEGIVLMLDGGARGTDFVMLNDGAFWFRPIGVSGTDLTKALMSKFSIPFEEAEELKCKMADSKQADRVFRVVEPVLRSLVGDVQRTIGYYKSLFRGVRVDQVLTTGNTFRFPRIDGFLEENLGIPVKSVPSPENFEIDPDLDEEELEENRNVLGLATGLALQGVGLAEINMSLLPPERQLQKLIRSKIKYGVAAVLMVGLMVLVSYLYSAPKSEQYADLEKKTKSADMYANKLKGEFNNIQGAFGPEEKSNQALASITPARGYLMEATTLLYKLVEERNARRPNVTSVKEEEENDLYKQKLIELKVKDEDEERKDRLRKSIQYHLDWKYSHFGMMYLKKTDVEIIEALYLNKVIDEKTKETKWELERILSDESKKELTKEEEQIEHEIRYLVRVNYSGFVVSTTTASAIDFKQSLFVMPGVITDSKYFDFKMEVGTNRNPKYNNIMLPSIAAKERETEADLKTLNAATISGEGMKGEEEEIVFSAAKERVVEITGSYLYQPKVWPERDTKPKAESAQPVSYQPTQAARPERS